MNSSKKHARNRQKKKTAAKGQHFIEYLYHFTCGICNRWWSVGDAPESQDEWFCPWCGARQEIPLKTSKEKQNEE